MNKARIELVKWARWGVSREPRIHYSMGTDRDDWLRVVRKHTAPKLPLTTDCSGFVTLCYRLAGLPDPNGFAYRKLGYTGTLLTYCKEIEKRQVRPGDLIVYGPQTGHHVVIVVEPRPDGTIEVVSHGQEKGPILLPHRLEASYQPRPIRFLRAPGVEPVPRRRTRSSSR